MSHLRKFRRRRKGKGVEITREIVEREVDAYLGRGGKIDVIDSVDKNAAVANNSDQNYYSSADHFLSGG